MTGNTEDRGLVPSLNKIVEHLQGLKEQEEKLNRQLDTIAKNLNDIQSELSNLWKLKVYEVVSKAENKEGAKESMRNFFGENNPCLNQVLDS